MKQVLETKFNQQLTLTPQLQQAIRLLQLSAQELSREIQEGLENNPLLELAEESENPLPSSKNIAHLPVEQQDIPSNLTLETDNRIMVSSLEDQTQHWSNISNKPYKDDIDDYINQVRDTSDQSIKAHLMAQLALRPLTPTDTLIADTLINMLDENGYFTERLEDIQSLLEADQVEVHIDEIAAILTLIQHFDPIGFGARNLQEYLRLQLDALPKQTTYLEVAYHLIHEGLDMLAEHDLKRLKQLFPYPEKELFGGITLLKSLSPRPNSRINDTRTTYIIPDVLVTKQNGRWMIELNSGVTPAIQINKHYAHILNTQKNVEQASQLKQQLQEARWLVKSLESRHETLIRVATCIVNKQLHFLEHGDIAMKPLILQQIAEETGLHESTISRITNQKYIQTPLGIYELKYFFSSHLNREDGQECSSTAIRAFIKKIILNEPREAPFSDNKIAQILSLQQGIHIARRTITKYREAMGIASSNVRKRAAEFETIAG